MKIRLGKLRRLVREAGKIGASPEYMKKEAIREQMQNEVLAAISSGTISDQASLDDFFKTKEMSLNALKMITFEIYQKIAAKNTKSK